MINDRLLVVTILFPFFYFLARATVAEERDFLKEIDLIKSIGYHKNVINAIGASTMMKPFFLVLEYMPHGDLLHYLRKKRTDVSFHWVFMRFLHYQECPTEILTH